MSRRSQQHLQQKSMNSEDTSEEEEEEEVEEEEEDEEREEEEEEEEQEDEEYEVEKIVNFRINAKTKKKEYLVKWEGWSMESNTWEPENNLRKVRDIVEEFEAALKQKQTQTLTSQKSTSLIPVAPVQAQYASSSDSKRLQNQQTDKTSKKSKQENTSFRSQKQQVEKTNTEPFSGPRSKNPAAPLLGYYASAPSFTDLSALQIDSNFDELFGLNSSKLDPQQRSTGSRKDTISASRTKTTHISSCSQKSLLSEGTELLLQQPQQQEYIFEEIKDKRVFEGKVEYLVQFSGIKQGQWVTEEDLIDFQEEVKQFNQQQSQRIQQISAEPSQSNIQDILRRSPVEITCTSSTDVSRVTTRKAQEEEDGKSKRAPANYQSKNEKDKGKESDGSDPSPQKGRENTKGHRTDKTNGQRTEKTNIHRTEKTNSLPEKTNSQFPEKMSGLSDVKKHGHSHSHNHSHSHSRQLRKLRDEASPDASQDEIKSILEPKMQHGQKHLPRAMQSTEVAATTTKHAVKRPAEQAFPKEQGDFRTDNVESVEVFGKPHQIMSSRIQVSWKSRDDDTKPDPTVYSASYIRRHEPDVLIDHMMTSLACIEGVAKSPNFYRLTE